MMGEVRDGQRTGAISFPWPMPPGVGHPLFAVVTDINGKLLESVARAQKDWAEFVHRRVKEDIAASHQLLNCQSLTDMQQVYSQYFQTAFEQYREQSERAVQRGKSMTGVLAESVGPPGNPSGRPDIGMTRERETSPASSVGRQNA